MRNRNFSVMKAPVPLSLLKSAKVLSNARDILSSHVNITRVFKPINKMLLPRAPLTCPKEP